MSKMYPTDIKECHEVIKTLRKELRQEKSLKKRKSAEKTYYKGLYEESRRFIKTLKQRIEELKLKIDEVKIKYKEKPTPTFDPINAGIYRVYNITTGESYVGQSSVNVWARCLTHLSPCKSVSQSNWHYDVLQHPENYKYEILKSGICNQAMLDKLEIYYIGKYDCIENGYNKQIGGKFNSFTNVVLE